MAIHILGLKIDIFPQTYSIFAARTEVHPEYPVHHTNKGIKSIQIWLTNSNFLLSATVSAVK
jgi:hypothetical protein